VRRAAWTGGQYSLYRVVLGLVVAGAFGRLLLVGEDGLVAPARAGWLPNVMTWARDAGALGPVLVAAVLLALAVAAGWRDRWAAPLLWYLASCAAALVDAGGTSHWMILGLLLLGHAVQPPAPYGSWAARGRSDPGGGWTFDRSIWVVLWIFLALDAGLAAARTWGLDGEVVAARLAADARSWAVHLSSPGAAAALAWVVPLAWTAAVPLALVPRLRPAAWALLVLVNLAAGLVLARGGELVAVGVAHLLAFDPGWVRPRPVPAAATVFFDGECGLCHRTVRFLLAEDVEGRAFVYAPLQGETFARTVPPDERARLPDSIVLLTPCGDRLLRSDAVLDMGARLGGLWRVLAGCGRLLPGALRDAAYDGVARVRKAVFPTPEGACPIVPPELARRFLP